MKTTDTFTYKSQYHEYRNCKFGVSRYENNGNLALWIEDEDGETVLVCSVNGERINGPDEIGIKNWSENVGMDYFLERMGIIGEIVDVQSSGFVVINYYKLTESGKELFADVK